MDLLPALLSTARVSQLESLVKQVGVLALVLRDSNVGDRVVSHQIDH